MTCPKCEVLIDGDNALIPWPLEGIKVCGHCYLSWYMLLCRDSDYSNQIIEENKLAHYASGGSMIFNNEVERSVVKNLNLIYDLVVKAKRYFNI